MTSKTLGSQAAASGTKMRGNAARRAMNILCDLYGVYVVDESLGSGWRSLLKEGTSACL